MRSAGCSTTTKGLSALGAAALIGLTAGCGEDEPEVETVHPDTAETAWPGDEGEEVDHIDDILCDLLSTVKSAVEEYFEALATGESVEVQGAAEAAADPHGRDMILIRVGDGVFRTTFFALGTIEE